MEKTGGGGVLMIDLNVKEKTGEVYLIMINLKCEEENWGGISNDKSEM